MKLASEKTCQVYRNLDQKYQKLRLELKAGLLNERLINVISFYFPYCAIQNLTRRLKKYTSKMAVSFRAAKLLRSKGELRIYRLNVCSLIKKICVNEYVPVMNYYKIKVRNMYIKLILPLTANIFESGPMPTQ